MTRRNRWCYGGWDTRGPYAGSSLISPARPRSGREVQSGKVAVPRVIVALCVWADESIQVSVTV
jgi:hypothetical protein